MNFDIKDIEQYLANVKEAVENDRYRLDRNAKRPDNIKLFLDYVVDESKAKQIILSLTAMDFSMICKMNIRDMSTKSFMYSAKM